MAPAFPSEAATGAGVRVVFFDVGDTLVAPYPSFGEIFAACCRGAGLAMSAAEAAPIASHVRSELAAWRTEGRLFSVSADSSRAFWQGLYERFLSESGHDYPPSLPDQVYECFRRSESYRVFPDVPEALERLRGAGLLLGVLSNWEEWLERLLDDLDLKRHFSLLLVSGVEGREKPDPELFRTALVRAGVPPQQAVHVGDSPESDCAPAVAAGMQAVLLDRRGLHLETPYRRMQGLAEFTHWICEGGEGR